MSVERMRNVMTGEIRDVETNSDEYGDLINEVYDHEGSARPKWEITGQHHARRVDNDEIQDEDLGYAHKPIPGAEVGLEGVGPEPHPERAITDAELESGIKSYEQKMEENSVQSSPTTNAALRGAESLEKSKPEERREKGREAAGSSSGRSRRSSSRKSNGGGSGSGEGSGSSSSGSSEGSSS